MGYEKRVNRDVSGVGLEGFPQNVVLNYNDSRMTRVRDKILETIMNVSK